MRQKTNRTLLQLLAQTLFVEHFQLGHHHLHQQLLQALPDGTFFVLVVAVPVDHFMMKALATPAYQVAIDRGAEPYARGFDGVVGHVQTTAWRWNTQQC